MEALINHRDLQTTLSPRDRNASQKRLSNINVDTHPGKFFLQTQKSVLNNAHNSTHTLEQFSKILSFPKLPREFRNPNPLINLSNRGIIRIKKGNLGDEDKVKATHILRSLFKHKAFVLRIGKPQQDPVISQFNIINFPFGEFPLTPSSVDNSSQRKSLPPNFPK